MVRVMKLHVYKTYKFNGSAQDPSIGKFKTLYTKEGSTRGIVSEKSGISKTTIGNWLSGKTKRPQFATMQAAVRTLNHSFELQEMKKSRSK
jgi:transcriptional regulator with XRE-family HTH domain